jgi:hypothetical protein
MPSSVQEDSETTAVRLYSNIRTNNSPNNTAAACLSRFLPTLFFLKKCTPIVIKENDLANIFCIYKKSKENFDFRLSTNA